MTSVSTETAPLWACERQKTHPLSSSCMVHVPSKTRNFSKVFPTYFPRIAFTYTPPHRANLKEGLPSWSCSCHYHPPLAPPPTLLSLYNEHVTGHCFLYITVKIFCWILFLQLKSPFFSCLWNKWYTKCHINSVCIWKLFCWIYSPI